MLGPPLEGFGKLMMETKLESYFDNQEVHSIGAISVAPSDPMTIYVGTGESSIRSTCLLAMEFTNLRTEVKPGNIWD